MATINFYLKEPKAATATPIYLQIHSHGKKSKWYFNLLIEPRNWNFKKQETKGAVNSPELNEVLRNYKDAALKLATNRTDVQAIKTELNKMFVQSNEPEPERAINDIYTFKDTYFKILPHQKGQKKGEKVTQSTINTYKQSFEIYRQFSEHTGTSLEFQNIDFDFFIAFVEYLETVRKFRANTVSKHVSRLKTFLNVATELGHNTYSAYRSKHFNAPKETANNIYLSENELQTMFELDLSNKPYLDRVRDMFLIGAYTGLRFSDFSTLQRANFRTIGNDRVIDIQTTKTGAIVTIPILPIAGKIFDKYTENRKLQLPKTITNQKFNEYLKELGKLIPELKEPFALKRKIGGISTVSNVLKWQLLTTHTARRSFATNMYILGVPVSIIMAITGHKTERSFYTYIQMQPEQHAIRLLDSYRDLKNSPKIRQIS
jgi:integrase